MSKWLQIVLPALAVIIVSGLVIGAYLIYAPTEEEPVQTQSTEPETTKYEVEITTESVSFSRETTEDPSAYEGERRIIQAGQDGIDEVEWKIYGYGQDEESGRRLIKAPVPEITVIGTKSITEVAKKRADAKVFYMDVMGILDESDVADTQYREKASSEITMGELMIEQETAAVVHITAANKLLKLEAPAGFEEAIVALVDAMKHRMKLTESLASMETRRLEKEEYAIALKAGLALMILQMRELELDDFVTEEIENK